MFVSDTDPLWTAPFDRTRPDQDIHAPLAHSCKRTLLSGLVPQFWRKQREEIQPRKGA
jgi:hypothetical protein